MKIGIITQSFFPVRGGVSQNVYHSAHELQQRGHDVTVITARFTAFDHEHDHGLRVRRIGFNVSLPVNGTNVCITVGRNLGQQVTALEHRYGFDIAHVHLPYEPFLPLAAMRTLRCPIVGTFHSNTATGRNMVFDVAHGLWKKTFDRLDGRIAVSEQARRFINQYFPAEYEVIPNGVDTSRFSPQVKPIESLPRHDGPTVVMIGRLTPRKGVSYLIHAWPTVVKTIPNARLVIVGGGFLQRRYQAQVDPAVRQTVRFTGYATEGELPRYYAAADVCCFPSTGAESFGIVLIEAMASGKPLVASDIPGYNRVLTNDKEGILVPPRDPKAIADALIGLLGDHARQKRFTEAGLVTSQQYSWPRVVDRLEMYYAKVLAR